MKRLNQTGSLHLGLLLALVVVVAVAIVGMRVMNQSKATDGSTTAAATLPASIKTKADLTQTGKVLDQTGSDIDASLNDTSLDGDINSML